MTNARSHPPTAPTGHYLICVAGPDQRKRIALSLAPVLFGRSVECNLMSDDPEVADRFAGLYFNGTTLRVVALAQVWLYIDGQPVSDAMLVTGQQLRLGSSLWELHSADAPSVLGLVNMLGDRISMAAGIEKPGEWSAREMFGDVVKEHGDEEIEAFFTVGTPATTPPLSGIDAHWPKPWVFLRIFGLTLLLYVGFVVAWRVFENENLIPGLMMIGSFAIPFALLIFFFEINVARNISMYQVIKLLLFGGLVSIVISLIFFRLTGLSNWLGAASAGLIEETGKGLTLLYVVTRPRYRWTLNGLLLGAAVGTGFAVFESAGYAMRVLMENGNAAAMRATIMQRGLLSILGGHVLWTGLVGAALWRVRGDQPFRAEMLVDLRFLRVVAVCMAMHMIWNSPIPSPLYLKHILLGVAAWLLVLGMIQDGLKQVRTAQATARVA